MKRTIVIIVSLLLCGFWALLFTPRFGSPGHYYYNFSQNYLLCLFFGWLPILTAAYFLIRKKKK
jgi:hypothetical protein